MPFDYYKRLSPSKQRIYRESERTSSIRLPKPERLHPLVASLEKALLSEDRLRTQDAAQRLVTTMVGSLKLPRLEVRVLERRPSNTWGELQGLYEPGEKGAADRITVWMRTARREQIVAFKTFLRTILHELCHHIDYELLKLKETFHTQGFFKRESNLYHQLIKKQGSSPI